jgi:hypothetical protein
MKEKKILIAVLLSVAFQAAAVRSPLQGSDEVKDMSDTMPEKETKKKKEQKKEKMKKEDDSSSKRSERKASRNIGGEQDETALEERRKKKADDKKELKDMSRVERQDKKKEEADQKKKEMRSKKRAELEKSIKNIEETIDTLEDQKAKALKDLEEEKAEKGDKEALKSHVMNHGSVKVDHLVKELQDQRQRLARKEEALANLSEETREGRRDEHHTRAALAKIYENNQKELRTELRKIEQMIKALRSKEVVAKNKLEDDKATYEDHLVKKRHAETRKDSDEVAYHQEALLVRESVEMKALHAKEKRVREDLDALRKKINENNEKRKKAAQEGGVRLSLRKERHGKEVDQMIKEGVHPEENHSRMFTETAVEIKHRKEELEARAKQDKRMKMDKEMSKKKGSSSKTMKKKDDNKMTEKKVVRKKRPMPLNDADRDMSLMEAEVQE